MAGYVFMRLKKTYKSDGLTAAQAMYRAWFITNADLYSEYQDDVDLLLTTEGYSSIIVTE